MFKEIESMIDTCDLHIVIKKKNGKLSVMTVPINEKGEHLMTALKMTGTAEELDQEYLIRIKEPVTTAVGLQTNEDEVKKDLKKTTKDSEKNAEKGKAKSTVPEPKKDPEKEKKDAYAKQVEELAKKEGLSGYSGDLFAEKKTAAVEINDISEVEELPNSSIEIDDDF